MPFIATDFPGLMVFEPQVWRDDRGYFFEAFNQKTLEAAGISAVFVQDNQARSSRGVLRGLHYQSAPFAQAKLVRVLEGEVLDVVVDMRPESPTYGKYYSLLLSAANKLQLFVPRGFAHGYVVLSESAEFFYKCDNYYSKTHEGGLRYDDPAFQIDWQLPASELLIAERDLAWPLFDTIRL
ncbi:MAG: dTDP-4-dehydrorhamnose 3,5-epimerase [Saprospiraceae bacterium]|jgi:dTDP-4-dehydrorhamnose 3,5-epimerase|nr:dTDP-4-dehydrorhamnose 3,5-epimerase [Saprospiraceae bacterium]